MSPRYLVVESPCDCPRRYVNTDGFERLPDGTYSDSYCLGTMKECDGWAEDFPEFCPLLKKVL